MRRWLAFALAGPLLLPAAARAAEAPPGTASCSGCHAASPAVNSVIPSLADKDAAAIAGIMREFKNGARPATVMGRIARGLSDPEIDAIAEWIAANRAP